MQSRRFDIRLESLCVSRLHEHGAGTGKLADQSLTRCDPGHDASRSSAFQNVLAVPGDEVAVIDDVFLAFDELFRLVSKGAPAAMISYFGMKWEGRFAMGRNETKQSETRHRNLHPS